MTKRDFFILLIKMFGLYSVVTTLFSVLPGNLPFAIMGTDTYTIILIAVTVLIAIGLFVALIFKSDRIVTLLKLDKGFDEDKIELGNLKPADIIKIAAFIIGGLLVLDHLPSFLIYSFFAFRSHMAGVASGAPDRFNWIISGLNVIIGFLLLTNYDFIANKLKTGNTGKNENRDQ
ncbi:hypothetical protein [Sinomicrobium weinanense]|uniref:Uncharacterized protein n=1 Tax=Sinomicrobium weinanense TaxID=2842200 RepID=A0A926JRF1_9FLAO|nr:hypothetical protein [Sinomicrobium weinanense]MBC9796125.1 hypothetical protein [Sinomicrobium weinanense]MBU3121876.1 hypothetical protein [Sinomicrobium weinanense]